MGLDEEDGSSTLHAIAKAYEEDGGGTLHEVAVYEEDSSGNLHLLFSPAPYDLTVAYSATNCPDVELSWTPDTEDGQTIHRCSGSSCDPFNDGSQIGSVSAGVGEFTDTGVAEDSGSYVYGVEGSDSTDRVTQLFTAGVCPI